MYIRTLHVSETYLDLKVTNSKLKIKASYRISKTYSKTKEQMKRKNTLLLKKKNIYKSM